jgi:metal-responsive CopG/Arc/MetJ family transcriptional regulator
MGETMKNEKVKWTVSVAFPLAHFLERYQKDHNLPTRSEALEQAIKLLRERELEREYAESALAEVTARPSRLGSTYLEGRTGEVNCQDTPFGRGQRKN